MTAKGERSNLLRFDELRRVLRLVNDLRDLPRGSEELQRRAVEGLAALVGADVGVRAELTGLRSGPVLLRDGRPSGAWGPRELSTFQAYIEADQRVVQDPALPRFAELTRGAPGTVATFTRADLIHDRDWYRSPHVQELRRAGNVDSCVYTAFINDADRATCIGLHRAWGERAFSERERLLVDVFHDECRFLHAPAARLSPAFDGLPPRLQDTLRALARGLGEKQIAAELGLSPHTVHDHVKRLHRHFGVASRGELLARCFGI